MKALALTAALLALSAAGAAHADPRLDARIDQIARAWAHANFEVRDPIPRAAAAAEVASQADLLARQYPSQAEPLVWEAIALSTEAGAKGGLSGLGLAKSARDLLLRAERTNPAALGDGSVYTSLGSLYAQVPGFPIGFGDPGAARAYFRKALAANPNGLDANYFYADFLKRQGDTAGAVQALERALAAPGRPGREIADRGRKAEASALLAQLRQKSKA